MSTELERISKLAKQEHGLQFTSLAHLLTVEMLGEAYQRLRKDSSPGVDGLTAQEYEQDLVRNLLDLHRRLREGRYRAQPVRRVYIEPGGKAPSTWDSGPGRQNCPASRRLDSGGDL